MSHDPTARRDDQGDSSALLRSLWIRVVVIAAWLAIGGGIVWLGIDFRSPKTAFVVFAIVSAPVIYWLMWCEDFDGIASTGRYRRALKSRKPLSPKEFYQEFYSEAGIDRGLVERFLNLTAEFWTVDRSMIRPEDNFCAMNGHDFDDEFIEKLKAEFAVELSDQDRSGVDGSFDSIVRWVGRATTPKHPQ